MNYLDLTVSRHRLMTPWPRLPHTRARDPLGGTPSLPRERKLTPYSQSRHLDRLFNSECAIVSEYEVRTNSMWSYETDKGTEKKTSQHVVFIHL